MANIHVSPLASPSLECLSPAELTNEESGQVEQVTPNQDENENDVFKGETKALGRKKAGQFETPSGILTTLRLSAGSEDASQTSSPKRSPVYCFHSFTYGVSGSSETGTGLHDSGKTSAELDSNDTCESESFDADSPNVWRTRMVVDPGETESGSPTILHGGNFGIGAYPLDDSVSLEETNKTKPFEAFQAEIHVKLQNSNDALNSDTKEATTAPKLLSSPDEDHSGEANGEENCAKPPVTRPSPEGAESSVLNTHQTTVSSQNGNITSCFMVPSKRVISDHQWSEIVGSPSGAIAVKNYWMSDEVMPEEKEAVDDDRAPLIRREKSYMRNATEMSSEEEEEEGTSVTCFPCRECRIL